MLIGSPRNLLKSAILIKVLFCFIPNVSASLLDYYSCQNSCNMLAEKCFNISRVMPFPIGPLGCSGTLALCLSRCNSVHANI